MRSRRNCGVQQWGTARKPPGHGRLVSTRKGRAGFQAARRTLPLLIGLLTQASAAAAGDGLLWQAATSPAPTAAWRRAAVGALACGMRCASMQHGGQPVLTSGAVCHPEPPSAQHRTNNQAQSVSRGELFIHRWASSPPVAHQSLQWMRSRLRRQPPRPASRQTCCAGRAAGRVVLPRWRE